MRVLTRKQMKEAEDAAVLGGTSYRALMENAGRAAAAEILSLCRTCAPSLLLLCGKGNNAGDAFVVGRILALQGWRVETALLCGEAFSPLAAENWERLLSCIPKQGGEPIGFAADVLVDGVFGTGFRGDLPPQVRQAFQKANSAAGIRVALDLPSGLDCDTGYLAPDTFRAAHTYTFGAYKPGMLANGGKKICGQIECLDIGL